ncbi:hypothetical protein BDK51DRAFT_27492, partial [Blyttiomyces helicus]
MAPQQHSDPDSTDGVSPEFLFAMTLATTLQVPQSPCRFHLFLVPVSLPASLEVPEASSSAPHNYICSTCHVRLVLTSVPASASEPTGTAPAPSTTLSLASGTSSFPCRHHFHIAGKGSQLDQSPGTDVLRAECCRCRFTFCATLTLPDLPIVPLRKLLDSKLTSDQKLRALEVLHAYIMGILQGKPKPINSENKNFEACIGAGPVSNELMCKLGYVLVGKHYEPPAAPDMEALRRVFDQINVARRYSRTVPKTSFDFWVYPVRIAASFWLYYSSSAARELSSGPTQNTLVAKIQTAFNLHQSLARAAAQALNDRAPYAILGTMRLNIRFRCLDHCNATTDQVKLAYAICVAEKPAKAPKYLQAVVDISQNRPELQELAALEMSK